MSLNAISTSAAGLAATQAAINIVSQNVANAGTAGYVKRTLSTVANGPNNSGVAIGQITRSFDAAALNRFDGMVAQFDKHLSDYKVLKPVEFTPIVWLMISGGIALFVLGGVGLLVTTHHVPAKE